MKDFFRRLFSRKQPPLDGAIFGPGFKIGRVNTFDLDGKRIVENYRITAAGFAAGFYYGGKDGRK